MWRRTITLEAVRLEEELVLAEQSQPAVEQPNRHDFEETCRLILADIKLARSAVARPRKAVLRDLMAIWTGSGSEAGWAALHNADENLLLVAHSDVVRAYALQMRSFVKACQRADATGTAYRGVMKRLLAGAPIERGDRNLLRELRREENDDWELARARLRVFRNILTSTIAFLVLVLIVLAVWGAHDPGVLVLRSGAEPRPADIALVEVMGGFGGLFSGVAAVRALQSFQRSYGLPLAQAVLKIPAGATSALVGMLLVQHQLFSAFKPIGWDAAPAYAFLFGVGQVAITRRVDSRAADLSADMTSSKPGGRIGGSADGSGAAPASASSRNGKAHK
jgi:hypothetical protein